MHLITGVEGESMLSVRECIKSVCGELSSKHFNTLKPRLASQNPFGCNL